MAIPFDDQLASLEARIVEDPEDLDGWLVFADLLQKQGDPHGELIALQIAADREAASKSTKKPAKTAFTKAFTKHAPALIKGLVRHGASLKDPSASPFVWRTGFIRRAILVEPPLEQRATRPTIGATIVDVLGHPAARLLGELSLQITHADELQTVLDAIAARPPPALYELDLFARCRIDSLAVIWKHLPRLRRISVTAPAFELDGLELAEARRVSFMGKAFPASTMAAIATAPWPVLERLELRVGASDGRATSENRGRHDIMERRQATASFEDIAPLLRRKDMPALTHLRIRNAPFAGAVLRLLSELPIAAQLQVLDLSKGTLTPQDIKYASVRKAAFSQLRELWVPQITQWAGVAADLAGMANHVITKTTLDLVDRELGAVAITERFEGGRE